MSIQRGDVVLYDAAYISQLGSKWRPMLVVQNDANNARMSNTILVSNTLQPSRVWSYLAHLPDGTRATRKPRKLPRNAGMLQLRSADRQYRPS